jgi:uncharacterized protein YukE
MAQFTGMDINEVRTLANQMRSSAQQIEQAMSALTNKLHGTPWVGADRERFVSEWDGTLTSQLRTVLNALDTAATTADKNASDQETTSAT